jgi:predicted RNase H-like nuclease
VAGVDGCRAGWVVATSEREGELRLEVVGPFDVVAGRVADGSLALVAVDMPIGLSDCGPRRCDVEARALLGPRRSSVFPAPVRAVLACTDYPSGLAASRAASGVGLSKQAWNLVGKIREVEASARRLGWSLVAEVHPELAFTALTGAPMVHPKRTAAGRAARLEALRRPYPLIDGLLDEGRWPGAAPDDLLDAAALAWSARRLLRGEGRSVGGEVDPTGLPMRISW